MNFVPAGPSSSQNARMTLRRPSTSDQPAARAPVPDAPGSAPTLPHPVSLFMREGQPPASWNGRWPQASSPGMLHPSR